MPYLTTLEIQKNKQSYTASFQPLHDEREEESLAPALGVYHFDSTRTKEYALELLGNSTLEIKRTRLTNLQKDIAQLEQLLTGKVT